MISTHILDLGLGRPASLVAVGLEKMTEEGWVTLMEQKTNQDGRIEFQNKAEAGIFRLVFKTNEYFKNQGKDIFFTEVPVIFEISNIDRKYHIPLLVNQFGYSTYRGS